MGKMLFVFASVLACCQMLVGQPTYFNNTYHEPGTNMISLASKPMQDGGYLVAGGLNSAGGYSAFYAQKLDALGNDQWLLHLYGGEFFGVMAFGNSMVGSDDGNYLLVGSVGSDGTDTDPLLVKFSGSGDTLWTRTYNEPEAEGHLQLVETEGGGYLLVGWAQQYYGPGQFDPSFTRVRKIDGVGAVEWTGEYGSNATVLYAEQTLDGGYILSGYRYAPASGYDMYVVKVDSLGLVEWDHTYGTDEHDGGCKVTQHPDGGYTLLGLIDDGPKNKFYFAELDSLGEVVSDTSYNKGDSFGINSTPYIAPNGDVLCMAYHYQAADPVRMDLMRFSRKGDILWEIPVTAHTAGEEYLRDIEPTPDGGFVLAGFTYSTPQMSWVVKVDSLGRTCSYIGCDSTAVTGVSAPPATAAAVELSVYPNPARDVAQLHYRLPPGAAFAVLELYDASGKKVAHRVLPAAGNSAQLDVSGLPPGVYVYSLVSAEGVLASGRLAVR